MAHQCINWSPIRRKRNVLLLNHGNAHVYVLPTEFKDLQDVARQQFDLGNAEVEFYSSCSNMGNLGVPVKIIEQVWGEEVCPYIGCLSVVVRDRPAGEHRVQSSDTARTPPPEQPYAVTLGGCEYDAPVNTTQECESGLNPSANETGTGDVSEDLHAPTEEPNDEPKSDINRPLALLLDDELKTPDDKGKSRATTRRLRRQRSAHSVDIFAPSEDDGDLTPRRNRSVKRGQTSPSIGSMQSGKREAGSKAKKQRTGSTSRSPSKIREAIKDIKDSVLDRSPLKTQVPLQDSRPLTRPIKHEKAADAAVASQAEDLPLEPTNTQAATDSAEQLVENPRIVIRVAHRSSRQESKFTVKGLTKVTKVIVSACRSFGLDSSEAKLFLIVDTDDDDEGVMENLFPCDDADSMMRAGAEASGESKFLLKLAGEQ